MTETLDAERVVQFRKLSLSSTDRIAHYLDGGTVDEWTRSLSPTYWRYTHCVGDEPPNVNTDTDDRPGGLTARAYLLFGLATLFGLAHHADHVIRGNHVGWPVTPEVNPFTYSLAVYPLVVIGFVLSVTGRAGSRYWSVVMTLGGGMLVFFHLSPWAVEPPGDVILPYADPLWGYVAFVILLALIGVVFVGAAYSILLWRRASA